MILVVGGIASGKRAYARALGYADSDMGEDASAACPVLACAQELVRPADSQPSSIADVLAQTKDVVLCTEVGSGIVPVSRDEREWRDRVGALLKELAKRADAVVRMVCGIPQVIKGEDWLLSKGLLLVGPEGTETKGEGEGEGEGHPAFGASFFSNRACKYFPCHEGVDERDFNCLYCYCPLYALGPNCGGNFTYLENGRKNCTNCILPHVRENGGKLVAARYERLAELARE